MKEHPSRCKCIWHWVCNDILLSAEGKGFSTCPLKVGLVNAAASTKAARHKVAAAARGAPVPA